MYLDAILKHDVFFILSVALQAKMLLTFIVTCTDQQYGFFVPTLSKLSFILFVGLNSKPYLTDLIHIF
jgi:hypothetical protein